MKLSPLSTFIFILSQLLFTTYVAAASLPTFAQSESRDLARSLSVRAGTLKSVFFPALLRPLNAMTTYSNHPLCRNGLPPSPYQWRIKGTTLSLVFGNFRGPPALDRARIVSLFFRAQTEVVNGVIENKGDGTIQTPNLIWRHGRMYVTVNQHLELPWSTLSKALVGIMDFYDAFYETACSVTILEDKAGILGEVIVGEGF